MGRLLLLLLLGMFAVVISPELRARVQPHVQWMLDPVYEWQVRSRVAEIARTLEAESSADRQLPTDRAAFGAYLASRYPGREAALDAWGTPLALRRVGPGMRVVSAGRDRRIGTQDDILSPPIRPR